MHKNSIAKDGTNTVSGYFPSTNVTYTYLPNHCFGTYEAKDVRGKNVVTPCG